jgi:membrane protease YdiL (CAAX protease family)
VPNHELHESLREAGTVIVAWVLIAGVGAGIVLAIRLRLSTVRPFPPQRVRATAWTGTLAITAFLVYFLAPSLVFPRINRTALARLLAGPDTDAKTVDRLARCAADVLAIPLQIAAWAGLLAVAGRPPAFRWSSRRYAGGFIAGYRTWLVLTPIVYAVSFTSILVYRLVAGERPEEHPIVQTLQSWPVPAGVFVLFFLQAVIVAPIKEELFFRGIVQQYLTTRPWGGDLAVLLAAIAGVLARPPRPIPLTDPLAVAAAIAPILFVFAVLPAYRLMDRWDFFRWLPFRDPVARLQTARAIVGTSLLFANLHANVWPTPIPLFVLALGLGWLAVRTQGVFAPIVVHMLFNAIVFATLSLQPAPPPLAPG